MLPLARVWNDARFQHALRPRGGAVRGTADDARDHTADPEPEEAALGQLDLPWGWGLNGSEE